MLSNSQMIVNTDLLEISPSSIALSLPDTTKYQIRIMNPTLHKIGFCLFSTNPDLLKLSPNIGFIDACEEITACLCVNFQQDGILYNLAFNKVVVIAFDYVVEFEDKDKELDSLTIEVFGKLKMENLARSEVSVVLPNFDSKQFSATCVYGDRFLLCYRQDESMLFHSTLKIFIHTSKVVPPITELIDQLGLSKKTLVSRQENFIIVQYLKFSVSPDTIPDFKILSHNKRNAFISIHRANCFTRRMDEDNQFGQSMIKLLNLENKLQQQINQNEEEEQSDYPSNLLVSQNLARPKKPAQKRVQANQIKEEEEDTESTEFKALYASQNLQPRKARFQGKPEPQKKSNAGQLPTIQENASNAPNLAAEKPDGETRAH